MTCENCGAVTRLNRNRGVFACDYCRSEFMPPAGEDGVHILEETKLKCPACLGLLSEGHLEHHPLLYCTGCRGMFIPMDEFGALLEVLRSYRDRPIAVLRPREAAAVNLPRLCPRCSQSMYNHPYGGPGNVVIDTCERCSANWLDKAELRKIVTAPDHRYGAPLFVASEESTSIPQFSTAEYFTEDN